MDLVRQQAPDLAGRFRDGNQAVSYLLQEARRAQELQRLAPYAQAYMQNAGAFEAWRRSQDEAQRAAQKKRDEWFKAPEWDPDWRNAVERDAQGNLVAKQGYPPGVVQKYLEAVGHQRSFLDKFSFDPIGSIKPGLLQLIQEAVQPMLRQGLGGYQEQQAAQSFVQQHKDWLFEGGRVGGQLTEWGQRFRGHVEDAMRMGVPAQHQGDYAMRMVQGEYGLAQYQQAQTQQPAQSANDAQKQAFLANAQRPVAPAPAARAPAQSVPGQSPARGSHINRLTAMMAQKAGEFGMKPDGLIVPH